MNSDLKIHKFDGAGNDFLIINVLTTEQKSNCDLLLGEQSRAELAIKLCNRSLNGGADGLIFLEPSKTCDIKWDFYNSDGSDAEMCGNAARCIGVFCLEHKILTNEFSLESLYGPIKVKAQSDKSARVSLKKAELIDQSKIEFDNKSYSYSFINSGVPHCVIELDVSNPKEILNLASFINQHERFSPNQTNVSFYHINNESNLTGISYERGVNDFTLACGTGAIAMAYTYSLNTSSTKLVKVSLPGGQLSVEFTKENSILTGPVNNIGEYNLKSLMENKL